MIIKCIVQSTKCKKNLRFLFVSKIKRLTSNIQYPTSGFTLVELLIVMTVLGVLAGIVLVNYPANQRRARDTRRRSDLKQYQTALELYYNRGNTYPNASGNLVSQCGTLGLTGCPNDPQGTNPYQISSSLTQYTVWARLELPQSPVTYFIACSNGKSGNGTSVAGVPTCPLP